MKNGRFFITLFFILSLILPLAARDAAKSIFLFNGKDLSNWKITDFGTQGPVSVQAGQLILGMGEGATGVTWDGDFDFPRMNYKVELQAQRIAGNDFFCGMTFPVNDDYLTLIVGGWGGFLVGLSCLDGLDASENETGGIHTFENKRWYTIRLRVANDAVQAWIDDNKVIDVDVKGRELSLRPEVLLSRPFGLASWYTKAAFRHIKLTLLNELSLDLEHGVNTKPE